MSITKQLCIEDFYQHNLKSLFGHSFESLDCKTYFFDLTVKKESLNPITLSFTSPFSKSCIKICRVIVVGSNGRVIYRFDNRSKKDFTCLQVNSENYDYKFKVDSPGKYVIKYWMIHTCVGLAHSNDDAFYNLTISSSIDDINDIIDANYSNCRIHSLLQNDRSGTIYKAGDKDQRLNNDHLNVNSLATSGYSHGKMIRR